LGWGKVVVIDEDLGKSASGTTERSGFERLLARVCQGAVGAVFAVEASRLARNGREWHTLLAQVRHFRGFLRVKSFIFNTSISESSLQMRFDLFGGDSLSL
jgi:DNA invertase Pin-like site-specific DNA recombinase